MIRLKPLLRFLLLAASLLMGLEGVAVAAPGKAGVISKGVRRFHGNASRPGEYAILQASINPGHAGLRQGLREGANGNPGSPAVGGFADTYIVLEGHQIVALSQYTLRHAHIVTSQYLALYPNHWFW